MSTVLGQRSDYGTVFTSLTATVDVVTVMMQECAANQVLYIHTTTQAWQIVLLIYNTEHV